MPEENQRLRLYKKIAGAQPARPPSTRSAPRWKTATARCPTPPSTCLKLASLRLECERIGIAQVDRKRGELQIRFTENAAVDPQHLMQLVARNAKRGAQFTPQGNAQVPAGRHALRRSIARDSRTAR